jgi:protein TonB
MVAGNVERRSMGALGRMGAVAGLHGAVIFLIARSLGIVPPLIDDEPKNVDARLIEERPPIDDRFNRIAEPPLQDLTIRVPIPDEPPVESDPQQNAISALPADPAHPISDGAGSAEPVPKIVGARQDASHPLSQPRYPSPDIREGNEGNADVEVYVLPNGRVADARIVRSSGFERLDQSAIEEAKRNWRLVPATRDGVPFAQWYKVRVTFKLTNR